MIQIIGKILLTDSGCRGRNKDVKPEGNNLSANLPDSAGELLDGNVRTASSGPHISPAVSGCFFGRSIL
jgi:hypothetical protein